MSDRRSLAVSVLSLVVATGALSVSILSWRAQLASDVANRRLQQALAAVDLPQIVDAGFALVKLDDQSGPTEVWVSGMEAPSSADFDGSRFMFEAYFSNSGRQAVDITWYTIRFDERYSMARAWPEPGSFGVTRVDQPPIRLEPFTQIALGIPLSNLLAPGVAFESTKRYLSSVSEVNMCVSFAGLEDVCGRIPFDLNSVPDSYLTG